MENQEHLPEEIRNNKPTFSGVWIPAEVMLDESLKATDKILYAEIACFGANGCYKKSDELMARLNIKSDAFQASCRRLREAGYIEERRNFGRVVRTITLGFKKVAVAKNATTTKKAPKPAQKPKNDQKPEKVAKVAETPQNQANSGIIEADEDYEARKNQAIEMAFRYWAQELGYAQKNSKANRYACYNILRSKDKGKEWLAEMIIYLKMAKADRYSGIKIGNFADLQRDWEKLLAWATSKVAQTQTAEIVAGGGNADDWLK